MRRVTFAIILLTVLFTESTAQTESQKLSDQYFREGMEAYNFSHSKQAIGLFDLAIQANPQNAKAHVMAGKSILLGVGKKKALNHFKSAYKLDPTIDEDILFLLGQAYHYNEQFDSALMYYNFMNEALAKSLKFGRVMKMNEVNWKIFECRNAIVFKANPVLVSIQHLNDNINSEWPDYAPTIAADESIMIYTTRRPEQNPNPSLAEDLEYFEEIFLSRNVNGTWQKAIGINEINSNFHNASVSLSPNGKEMFVYSDENGGDVYETDLLPDGTWSRPSRLNGFINSPYFESSAAVTADNNTLFFVSDRPEGYGGTDIYMATRNKRGEWATVQNLGPIINTERDEADVFVSGSGRHIYFSSNGHAGMGDLDIYRSEYDSIKNQWSEPLNLGYPINSVESDIYFVLTGNERYAYFSSVRQDGRGDQDIYRVDLKDWRPVERQMLASSEQAMVHQAAMIPISQTSGKIDPAAAEVKSLETSLKPASLVTHTDWIIHLKDGGNNQPVDAEILVTDEEGQESKMIKSGLGLYNLIIDLQSTQHVKATVSAAGYLPVFVETTLDRNDASRKLLQTVFLTRVDDRGDMEKSVPVLSVFYGSNEASTTYREILDLAVLRMQEETECRVTIVGHTDSYGDDKYNQQLSRRRAEEAKKYLINAGIAESRIHISAEGEVKPKGNNKTSAGRRINRRTDLIFSNE